MAYYTLHLSVFHHVLPLTKAKVQSPMVLCMSRSLCVNLLHVCVVVVAPMDGVGRPMWTPYASFFLK